MGIRSRKGWYKHKTSRKQLVRISDQRVQANGGRDVLVEGQEVWEEVLDGADNRGHKVK